MMSKRVMDCWQHWAKGSSSSELRLRALFSPGEWPTLVKLVSSRVQRRLEVRKLVRRKAPRLWRERVKRELLQRDKQDEPCYNRASTSPAKH